jgi:hypothetical protein
MAEWLEQHPQWVIILAVIWIAWGLSSEIYKRVKNKTENRKSNNEDSINNMTDLPCGVTRKSNYGGGSAGGAGSARRFDGTESSVSNHLAVTGYNLQEMSNPASIIAPGKSMESLANIVSPGVENNSDGVSNVITVSQAIVEASLETVTGAVGECIAEVLKE